MAAALRPIVPHLQFRRLARPGHLATLAQLRNRFDLVQLASDEGVTVYRFERR
jgi:hypothetical protein